MPKKSSAYYQRQYRERLRSQGLVKKEVWILPDHAKTLSTVETLLREENSATNFKQKLDKILGDEPIRNIWTTHNLYEALSQAKEQTFNIGASQSLQMAQLQHIELKLLGNDEKIKDSDNNIVSESIIHVVMKDFGDLPIFLTVQGEQIIAETILCTVDEITDIVVFNDVILRTHKFFPLSTISLDTLTMSTGESYDAYQMFGSLSATASLQEVMLEIQMLASNVMQALEAYSDGFKTPT